MGGNGICLFVGVWREIWKVEEVFPLFVKYTRRLTGQVKCIWSAGIAGFDWLERKELPPGKGFG